MTDIPQAHSNDAIVGREQAACLELRLEGHSFRAIADQLGLSLGTAFTRVRDAISLEVNPLADELREIEVQRLDQYLARLAPKIRDGDDRAINTAVRISESRRRMLGLDRPVAIDARVTEVTQQDMELQEMIRAAKAKAALEESVLLAAEASEEEQ
ncbi:hypothetical protein ACFYY2_29780 [Streptomyces sp. NPDC001822]|uniref:hypothetical protein n=1 Tax=Streptomyces sp. NPDC001822 TaxID=3364614 RepID=UPI0036D021EA